MFETLSYFSIFISLSIGSAVGLLIYLVFKKPVTVKGVKKILVGLLFAPIIGKNVYLFGNRISEDVIEGVVVAPLLFGILASLIVCYVIKNSNLNIIS